MIRRTVLTERTVLIVESHSVSLLFWHKNTLQRVFRVNGFNDDTVQAISQQLEQHALEQHRKSQGDLPVTLVVNGFNEDIELKPINIAGKGLVAQHHKKRWQAQLAKQNPDALVHQNLTNPSCSHVVVEHLNISDEAMQCLTRWQNECITFSSVFSASTLYAASVNTLQSKVLFISTGSGLTRHVLCEGGVALFSRAIHSEGREVHSEATTATTEQELSVRETLSHLSQIGHLTEPLELMLIDTLQLSVNNLLTHDLVSHVSFFPSPSELPEEGNDIDPVLLQGISSIQISKKKQPHYQKYSCQSLLLKNRLQLQLKQLRIGFFFVLSLCVIGSAYAAYGIVDVIKQRSQLQQRAQLVKEEVGTLSSGNQALSDNPVALSNALLNAEIITLTEAVSPRELLTRLAYVISAYPAIELKKVSWQAQPNDSLSQVPEKLARYAIESAFESVVSTGVQLNVQFTLPNAPSIRDRQEQFSGFVTTLRETSGVVTVDVLSSPLSRLDSQQFGVELNSKPIPVVFEIALLFHEVQ